MLSSLVFNDALYRHGGWAHPWAEFKKLRDAWCNTSTNTIVVRGAEAEAFASKVQAILSAIEASLIASVRDCTALQSSAHLTHCS